MQRKAMEEEERCRKEWMGGRCRMERKWEEKRYWKEKMMRKRMKDARRKGRKRG